MSSFEMSLPVLSLFHVDYIHKEGFDTDHKRLHGLRQRQFEDEAQSRCKKLHGGSVIATRMIPAAGTRHGRGQI